MEAMRKDTAELQPTMVATKPQKEHEWLQKLVGEWTFEGEASMEPGMPSEEFTGTESVRPIGDLWIVAEARIDAPGMAPMINVLTLGFDPQKGRFVGTFVASMMTYLWVYDGELDPNGRTLHLYSTGPTMGPSGKTVSFRESIEFVSDDERIWRSTMQADDGDWQEVMRSDYRRKR